MADTDAGAKQDAPKTAKQDADASTGAKTLGTVLPKHRTPPRHAKPVPAHPPKDAKPIPALPPTCPSHPTRPGIDDFVDRDGPWRVDPDDRGGPGRPIIEPPFIRYPHKAVSEGRPIEQKAIEPLGEKQSSSVIDRFNDAARRAFTEPPVLTWPLGDGGEG